MKTGSKLMILGKRYDPEQEEAYREILELERKCKSIENKMEEVAKEVNIKNYSFTVVCKFDLVCNLLLIPSTD